MAMRGRPRVHRIDFGVTRVEAGLCLNCGARPARHDRTTCVECSLKRRKPTTRPMQCWRCFRAGHDRRTCDLFSPTRKLALSETAGRR